MLKKLFVASLSWETTNDDLKNLFEENVCLIEKAYIIRDKETGKSRGFGFVELDETNVEEAIRVLDGMEFMGRTIVVKEAEEKKPPEKNYKKEIGGDDYSLVA